MKAVKRMIFPTTVVNLCRPWSNERTSFRLVRELPVMEGGGGR
jgi:hypothetical protein